MSLAIQAQIRRNAEEIRAYLDDLRGWEQSFDQSGGLQRNKQRNICQERQDEQRQPEEQRHSPQHPGAPSVSAPSFGNGDSSQVANSAQGDPENPKLSTAESKKKYARDLNSLPDYYKAWDAYDPDAEEAEAPAPPPKQPPNEMPKVSSQIARGGRQGSQAAKEVHKGARMRVCASGAPPSFRIDAISKPGLANQAIEELLSIKGKGNACFAAGRYGAAVEFYTEALKQAEADTQDVSIACLPEAAADVVSQIYGNRAAANFHCKKYDKCISDCTEALRRRPRNIKFLHRRGLALAIKGDTTRAEQDLREALKLLKEGSLKQQLEQRASPSEISSGIESGKQVPDSSPSGGEPQTLSDLDRSALIQKILQDLKRILQEGESQKYKEQEERKAALLQPLRDSQNSCSEESLRPLRVRTVQ